ncbi:MAG: protein-export chaperone SecB [Deltaproteobacteria bacterium]|jgi:preprotein translocase subunit SecB|nr:protein-export chaperone SecB [Deltaproteobacteria bacterium]
MFEINCQMVNLRLKKTIFVHNPNFQPPPQGQHIAVALHLQNGGNFEDDTTVNFVQNFRTVPGPQMPFNLEVEFEALFTLSEPVPENKKFSYIHLVFPQFVFPHVRDYVAETTKLGGFPPLTLNLELFKDGQRHEFESDVPVVASTKWTH